jgi:branched-chain amino acid transport system substrate-binding protein
MTLSFPLLRSSLCAGLALAALLPLSCPAAAEILVASVGPMKGQYGVLGEQVRRGVAQAIADINAAGGVNGEPMVLSAQDDGCDTKQAVAVANDLVAKHVGVVIGHYCSGAALAAAKIYEDAGVLMISPAASSPRVTDEGGWNVFRTCGRDDAQGTVAGTYVAKAYAGKSVAILSDGSMAGVALATAFKAALNANGLTETVYETFKPGQNDYPDLVQKVLKSNADVVYLAGPAAEGGAILRALKDLASPAVMIGNDALLVEQFWAVAGTAGEDTLATFAADPLKIDAAKALIATFQAADYAPEGATLPAYAAVQAFAQAAAATHGPDGKQMSQWLRSGATIHTVLGDIAFTAKGDLQNPGFAWFKWSAGKFSAFVPAP